MLGLLSLIPLILMLVGIAVGGLLGFRRGLISAAIRFGSVVLSAIIAFFVAGALGNVIGDMLIEQGVFDSLFGAAGDGEMLSEIMSGVEELVLPLPIFLLVVPIIFVPVFLLLKWLTYIAYAIVAKIFRLKSWGSNFLVRKLGGIAVGALQGLLVAILCLMPVAGLTSVAAEAETVVVDENGEYPDEGIEELFVTIDTIKDSPAVAISHNLGGRAIYGALSTTELNGVRCDLSEGVIGIIDVLSDASVIVEMDWSAPHEHREEIHSFINSVHENEYVTVVLSRLFNAFGEIANEDIGELISDSEGPFTDIMSKTLGIFATTTPDTLYDDLNTMFEALFVLGENGVIEKMQDGSEDEVLEAMTKKLEDGTLVIDKVVDILADNPHTLPVVEALTKMSITIMCDAMGMDEDAVRVYENLKTEVNTVLQINRDSFANEEAYKAEVSAQLDTALKNNDIELEESVLNGMTDYIAENYADTSEISDADVQKAILSYYGSYAENAD